MPVTMEDYYDDDDLDIVDMIRYDRMCSEFCGQCLTRHHPDHPCQEDEDD